MPVSLGESFELYRDELNMWRWARKDGSGEMRGVSREAFSSFLDCAKDANRWHVAKYVVETTNHTMPIGCGRSS